MLIHPTVERLRSLGLAAMADTLAELQNNPEAAEMPHADWLGLLIDREVTCRDNRRLSRRLSAAKLRQAASIENVDYRTARGLDRSLFQTLASSQWIRDCNHLAIVGPTGTGKSWLACALGNKACRDGFSVLYKRASRLFADLAQARGEGRLSRLITSIESASTCSSSTIGDPSRSPPISVATFSRSSMIATTRDPFSSQAKFPCRNGMMSLRDPTLGDAILDRIVHNAHRIELKGDSLRRRADSKKKS